MKKVTLGLAFAASIAMTAYTFAAQNKVDISVKGSETCIASNGIPNHEIGATGRNSAAEQNLSYCFPSNPVKTDTKTTRAEVIGIMLNGVPIRPNTAEYYDASARKGFSRDDSSGWRLSALGNPQIFRTDVNYGHADHRGLYHYHGMPAALIPLGSKTLIGYAADGHEIHYSENAQPSYVLKTGTRPSGPGGTYDGTYEQDWQYLKGAGNLDECNGAVVNGTYVYFATDAYPYFQRCHYGEVGSDFVQRGPRAG
ncbi:MAG: YHYH protein [Pseudomonadota bacterium]